MSAPEIPNLFSLRGAGPRLRGTGRGRGGGAGAGGSRGDVSGRFANKRPKSDLDVQSTDSDAAVSRLSAVSLGYLEDPYAHCFVNGPGVRRMPVINRGTYARTSALDILIDAFLSSGTEGGRSKKQIISLGAGTDTRYFRLRAKQKTQGLIYHEIDFPDVSGLKYATVAKRPVLAEGDVREILFKDTLEENTTATPIMEEPEWGFNRESDGISELAYCFHPIDLRKLPYIPGRNLDSFKGIQKDIPTLLISECCLCYLAVETARDVVKFFADQIPSLGVVLYEPIGGHDAFGQMMVSNLAARNLSMPTVQEYKDLADQKQRLNDLGFGVGGEGGSEGVDIETVWNRWVGVEEKARVDAQEGLDEVEEWQVLARHYAVVWGWKGEGWAGWEELRRRG